MSAKEMFERLGYELEPEETYAGDKILPYRCYKKNMGITFYLKEKQFVKTKRATDCIAIKESELKAIIQQCKELGWLEDEKQETNYEHYKDEIRDADFDFAVRDGKVIPCDGCPCSECLFFGNHTSCSVLRIEWLYQKYQRKYKLTQFEYDLIKAFDRCKECCLLNEIECLKKLSQKGYFNGIDPFTKVHDIIDNCEVI